MGIQGKSIKETLHNFKINIRYKQNYFKINMLNTYPNRFTDLPNILDCFCRLV